MKIIILGAGQVGTTLAANLVSEDNDITLVDNESQHLQNLQDKMIYAWLKVPLPHQRFCVMPEPLMQT